MKLDTLIKQLLALRKEVDGDTEVIVSQYKELSNIGWVGTKKLDHPEEVIVIEGNRHRDL